MKVMAIHRWLRGVALGLLLGSLPGWAMAQIVYGVGANTANGTTYNRLLSVNPTSGAATNLCALSFASVANAVSPVDGLVYYIESGTANPRLATINPQTCTNGTAVTTNLVTGIIRATFCPDGRLYAASNTGTGTGNNANPYFYDISPSTGQINRTLRITGILQGGSGDFACVNNGDMYVLANTTNGGNGYSLYRITGSTLQSAANNSSVAATLVGPLGNPNGAAPNGLSEVDQQATGCAAWPANPCLIASTGATNQTWGINSLTGAYTNIGTTGFALTDLSRSFPVDAVVAKARTSASPTPQASTITYSITLTNNGPGLVSGGATVVDTLNTATFNVAAATWTCSVTNAGSATVVTTACPAASGTGNISGAASLSRGGVLTFTLNAPLLSTFSGTATNAATLTLAQNVTDPTPGNNTGTATTTVTPTANLTLTKSNGASTVSAGGTTSYTLTVANLGPGDASNSVLKDPATMGLTCTAASCSGASGGAVCPAAGNVTVANLQGAGVTLPTLPANSTLTFQLSCGVTATGQ